MPPKHRHVATSPQVGLTGQATSRRCRLITREARIRHTAGPRRSRTTPIPFQDEIAHDSAVRSSSCDGTSRGLTAAASSYLCGSSCGQALEERDVDTVTTFRRRRRSEADLYIHHPGGIVVNPQGDNWPQLQPQSGGYIGRAARGVRAGVAHHWAERLHCVRRQDNRSSPDRGLRSHQRKQRRH